jgi:hypothetical protein
MVEYSNQPASDSDIAESYTESGYESAFKNPQESADEMINTGINPESVKKIYDVNEKVQVTSPALRKKKILKKLFLQYIRKYISNPKKYIDHPKQIRNLPSWFDDAIALFNDAELSRDQKRAIREFFYGLIQYRDAKVASGEFGPDTTETNRQLGERSPYQYEYDSVDSTMLPEQQAVGKINVMDIAKRVASENVKEDYQPSMEDYVESGTEAPVNVRYYEPPVDNTNISNVKINQPSAAGMSLESFIRPIGGIRNKSLPQSVPQPVSTVQNVSQPIIPQPVGQIQSATIPARQVGFDLTHFIIGGRQSPITSPFGNRVNAQPQQLQQPRPLIPPLELSSIQSSSSDIQYRKSVKGKKNTPKIIRKKSKGLNRMVNSIPRSITLKSILGKSTSIKDVKKYKPSKNINIGKVKSVGGLSTIRNMDQVFTQIKKHSKNSYTGKDMKMPIVGDIKRQCEHAFKNNSFKVEAMNMKNNYFDDVKGAYPKIRMEMEMMGDIHENNMMSKAMRGLPTVVNNVNTSAPYIVKRGSMRPTPIGITDYDFDLGNVFKKKKKVSTIDEDIFYED